MDDILKSLELQHLINRFRQNEVKKVLCWSDKKLDEMGVIKPTDKSRLREQCADYVEKIAAILEKGDDVKAKGHQENLGEKEIVAAIQGVDDDVQENLVEEEIAAAVQERVDDDVQEKENLGQTVQEREDDDAQENLKEAVQEREDDDAQENLKEETTTAGDDDIQEKQEKQDQENSGEEGRNEIWKKMDEILN